jgi:hypothetical protein
MDDNNDQPPGEPIIIPILASLNIDDIPTLDLLMTATAKSDDRISPHDVDEAEVQTSVWQSMLIVNRLS